MERFPCPIYASSMRPRNSNCVMWTWSWRRAITDRELLRKKPPQASRSMGVRKMHRVCAAFSTNAKSPHQFSRYEHHHCPSRCLEGPRLHRSGSPLSLHCGDAFRLLRGASIPRLHGYLLGLPNQHLLEQASHQETRPDGMFSEEWNGLPLVLAPAVSPDRPREPPQSPRTRDRIHPAPYRDARFCPLAPSVEVPGNGARKGQLFLRPIERPESIPSLEDLSRTENHSAHSSLLRR